MGTSSQTEHPYESRARVLDSWSMADDLSNILSADLEDDGDLVIEGTLRPRTLAEYIGQRDRTLVAVVDEVHEGPQAVLGTAGQAHRRILVRNA